MIITNNSKTMALTCVPLPSQILDFLFKHHTHYMYPKLNSVPKRHRKAFEPTFKYSANWFHGIFCRKARKLCSSKRANNYYINKQYTISTTLYHGTSSIFLESILRLGIQPLSDGFVCLTDNFLMAEYYSHRTVNTHSGFPCVIAVNVAYLKRKIKYSIHFITETHRNINILPHMQYVSNHHICPSRIEKIYSSIPYSALIFEFICILADLKNPLSNEITEFQYLNSI